MDNADRTQAAGSDTSRKPARRRLFRSVWHLALAGIGVPLVLAEEVQTLYQRSVERGGSTVEHLTGRLPRLDVTPGVCSAPSARNGHPDRASRKAEAVLARMDLPTAADVAALSRGIAELEAKIDRLAS